MKYKKISLFFILIFFANFLFAQNKEQRIDEIKGKIKLIENKKDSLLSEIKMIRLRTIQEDLKKYGLPKGKNDNQVIFHKAMVLSYNEKHEQPNWVAHIVPVDVKETGVGRSNDFREDPLVKTGSSCEKDYFLKHLKADSTYEYDGFGFDRGHLAPSADFRWFKDALSESYFYSNMSPQRPDFNRGIWAKLENYVRQYVIENNEKVFVVTGGILNDNLPVVERSVNKVTIPEEYFKVLLDIDGDVKSGIGFILPNEASEYPVISYAVSIDEVEKRTGIDFFPALPDSLENRLEANFDIKHWQTEKRKANVSPIHRNHLPKNAFNTVQARSHYDSKIKVCGTVIGVHKSRKKHIYLNLDRGFPEQLFSVNIWKDNLVNFSYNPAEYLLNKKICVKGFVQKKYGRPAVSIDSEKQITFYEEEMKKKRK